MMPEEEFDRFVRRYGFTPDEDDIERATCPKAGECGHQQCGECPDCGYPRFTCRCAPWKRRGREILQHRGQV